MTSHQMDEEKAEGGLGISVEETPRTGTDGVNRQTSFPGSPETQRTNTNKSWTSTSPLVQPPGRISRLYGSLRSSLSRRSSEPSEPDSRERVVIVNAINEHAPGYPMLAAFLDSDDNFMVHRRFGYLQSRLLLEKQDDLRLLEDELRRMDDEQAEIDVRMLTSRSDYGEGWMADRVALLAKIEKRWLEYSQLLTAAQQMTQLNKPTAGEYRSVKNWIENVEPVADEDSEFICHKEDLITLRPGREHAWLDAGVERLLQLCKCDALKFLFQSKETRAKTDGTGNEVFYTRSRIERLVVMIITMMILVLLIVPIYVLYRLTDHDDSPHTSFVCIGVLLVSTLAFSACISLFTRARRHEILAASAAYCAVLVVFIGNVGGRSAGRSAGVN